MGVFLVFLTCTNCTKCRKTSHIWVSIQTHSSLLVCELVLEREREIKEIKEIKEISRSFPIKEISRFLM